MSRHINKSRAGLVPSAPTLPFSCWWSSCRKEPPFLQLPRLKPLRGPSVHKTLLLWSFQVFLPPHSPNPTTQDQPKTGPIVVNHSLIHSFIHSTTIYQGCTCAKSYSRQSCRKQNPCLMEPEYNSDKNPTIPQVSTEHDTSQDCRGSGD